MYYVYILESLDEDKKHYIGYTRDLRKRLREHNSEENRGYTKNRKWRVKYYEVYESKELALKREKRLKNHSGIRKQLYKRIGISE